MVNFSKELKQIIANSESNRLLFKMAAAFDFSIQFKNNNDVSVETDYCHLNDTPRHLPPFLKAPAPPYSQHNIQKLSRRNREYILQCLLYLAASLDPEQHYISTFKTIRPLFIDDVRFVRTF